jgi:hypothetical protein
MQTPQIKTTEFLLCAYMTESWGRVVSIGVGVQDLIGSRIFSSQRLSDWLLSPPSILSVEFWVLLSQG